MPRTVLLRHDLPDGSSHFDWMIQRPGAADAPLVTFRVSGLIDAGVMGFRAERIGDHRAAYLDYEGELAGGRGCVIRVAAGEMEIVADKPARFVAQGHLGDASGRFEGATRRDGTWEFAFTTGA